MHLIDKIGLLFYDGHLADTGVNAVRILRNKKPKIYIWAFYTLLLTVYLADLEFNLSRHSSRGDISGQADEEFARPGAHSACWPHLNLRKAECQRVLKNITGGEFIPSCCAAV